VTTWHERATHWGDVAENAKALLWQAAVGLAMITAPVLVGYGAAGTAGELATGMNPKGVLLIQVGAGATAATVMLLLIVGIDRFTRPAVQLIDSEGGE